MVPSLQPLHLFCRRVTSTDSISAKSWLKNLTSDVSNQDATLLMIIIDYWNDSIEFFLPTSWCECIPAPLWRRKRNRWMWCQSRWQPPPRRTAATPRRLCRPAVQRQHTVVIRWHIMTHNVCVCVCCVRAHVHNRAESPECVKETVAWFRGRPCSLLEKD